MIRPRLKFIKPGDETLYPARNKDGTVDTLVNPNTDTALSVDSDSKTNFIYNRYHHLPLETQRQRLPVFQYRNHILYLLEKYQTLVLIGETGCGKSTQVPQIFFWISSHKGITGNEIADKTAYEGINSLNVIFSIGVPLTDTYTDMNDVVSKLWKDIGKANQEVEDKGKLYGSIPEDLPLKPWYFKLKEASGDFITMINRIRFGHSTAPAHLARLSIINDNICKGYIIEIGNIENMIFN